MPVPLSVAVPAAAAGLAYFNARSALWYDILMLRSVLPAHMLMTWANYRDRVNIFYRLEQNAQVTATANHPFLLFKDKSYTYAQVYDRALRYGVWWKESMGVQKGDVVGMNFINSDNFIFLWMGLWAIGAKPAFINYNLRGDALVHCVKTAKTNYLLVDPAVADDIVTASLHINLPTVRIEVFTAAKEAEALAMEATRYPDDQRSGEKLESMAVLIFTSGTTGLPKAAVVAWGKMMITGNFSYRWMGFTSKEIYYTCMPLYHSTACLLCFSTVLYSGTTMGLGERFSNTTFWPDVRRFRATAIQYVGETCRYLLVAPPQFDPVTHENLDRKHSVRVAFGNGMRPDVWNRFKERFGIETIAEFYGATEGTFATFNLSKNDFTAGAVGRNGWLYRLVVGFEVAYVVMDWDDDQPLRDPKTGFCRRCKHGEPGEMIFKLPAKDIKQRFQGYYGNQKATESKIMRNVFSQGDAWFRTGDSLVCDNEGRVYFHDRIGDTFRWKSENVSTAEVAHVVSLHPAVVEANVYGIALPNHDGRAGCVALVLKQPPTQPLLQSLAVHVSKSLPRYARPLFLRAVEDVSAHTTGTNKQQKHGLREESADPDKTGKDKVFWLKDDEYVPFSRADWEMLKAGKVKL